MAREFPESTAWFTFYHCCEAAEAAGPPVARLLLLKIDNNFGKLSSVNPGTRARFFLLQMCGTSRLRLVALSALKKKDPLLSPLVRVIFRRVLVWLPALTSVGACATFQDWILG